MAEYGADDYDDEPCYHEHDEGCYDSQGFWRCEHTHCFNCGGCRCPGYCDDYQTYNLRPAETGGAGTPDSRDEAGPIPSTEGDRMTPTIGRIVHVLMAPDSNNGSDVAPAVITRVWSDTCVNLRVLRDGYPGPEEWLTSWSLHESREALEAQRAERQAALAATSPGLTVQLHGAFWPPHV